MLYNTYFLEKNLLLINKQLKIIIRFVDIFKL